ncbi:unnamed protein product [Haemonchus placei]|uniref:Methyltransf_25 domain-containing protein n=1 Tax=Haemonchus placei TaxID=6290 RepID=A0A0N4WFD0_HAEPC|nr:unnamed protein product [Haemonchus placei]
MLISCIGFGNDNVLELGYGRGNGLKYCFDRVIDGEGAVFGIERSPYMEDCARNRFILELAETTKIRLDHAPDLRDLPYPPSVFHHIFHVDVFYFIHQDHMFDICKELLRVLKPGGTMACGMHFGRLRKLTKWRLLEESQWDPMRYMMCLEPAGFTNIKVDYKSDRKAGEYQIISCMRPASDKVDYKSDRKAGEYQIISCMRPASDKELEDPDIAMKQLELKIKKEMLISELLKSRRKLTKEELDILNEELPGQEKKS